ncbi:MAG: HU family DNA-binding protein [Candidatus Aminicenantes bacterium]|nr:HU family DNA-binding protein [Candidatus Aminicenantes bacterium]
MNKRELSETIAKDLMIKKFEVYNFIDLMIEIMVDNLEQGKKIVLSNFGTFKVIKRNNKRVINPNNKKPLIIPAKKIVKFLPSKNLKKIIKG